jgi:alanine dehydrogenase
MASAPVWLTEKDVTSAVSITSGIGALEGVLAAEGRGEAENMTKTHLMVGANNPLNALGGSVAAEGVCGTKTWVNIQGKSATLLVLFSLENGDVKAVVEATALGQIRTAAMTGLGTKWLAPEGADEMAIIGTGKQSIPQMAACMKVRPLKTIRVYARTRDKLVAFVDQAQKELGSGTRIVAADSLEAACKDAPIITLCTNAQKPFFEASMASKGAHINAIGSIVPARAEFTQDVFSRVTTVAVDSVPAVQELSREFIDYYGAGKASWDQVKPLSKVIHENYKRPANTDLTLFKAMGMGIADLAMAIEVLRKAEGEQGFGHKLPERVRFMPRF